MTTVWDQTQPNQPHTHLFIVGVGAYRHLRGGSGPRATIDLGLKQLTSPPISARAFAHWVLNKFNNPDAPLGTVEMLLSEAASAPFELPDGRQIEIESATIKNIKTAFDRWYERCDDNKNNISIFYFCGHGVMVQGDRLLLAEDFGENKRRPFENMINFDNTFKGMANCKPSLQCYFVDACRQVPWEGLEYQTVGGVALVAPKLRGGGGYRDALILNASSPNDGAYARSNNISRFTKALLQGLDGGGCKHKQGKWIVTTLSLAEAVCDLVERLNRVEGGFVQRSSASGEANGKRAIHILKTPPVVPVMITFDPPHAQKQAHLTLESCRHQDRRHRRTPSHRTWEPEAINPEVYKLDVRFPSGGFQEFIDDDFWVVPPFVETVIPLEEKL